MDDLALNPRRSTAALRFLRGATGFAPLLLLVGLLFAAGCGDDPDDDGDGGGKGPDVTDVIQVAARSESVTARTNVRVTAANWFEDGATFRGNLAAEYDDDDDGDDDGDDDDDETITASLTLWAPRGEAVEPGTYTLTSDTRKADHATLSLNFDGDVYDVTEGSLTLRAIEGDRDSSDVSEKLKRLSLTFEGTYTRRGQQDPRPIEGEIIFGSSRK